MIRVNDNVETRDSSKLKFSSFNACHCQFFPCLWSIGLLSSIYCLLELFKLDKTRSYFCVILSGTKKQFGCFVVFLVVTAVTNTLIVNRIWSRNKVFKITKFFSFSKCKNKGIVNLGILNIFASHHKIF